MCAHGSSIPWAWDGTKTGSTRRCIGVFALWRAAELPPSVTDDVDSVRRLIAHDAAALLVAEIDGEIVGSLCGTGDGWRGNLYRLAVHPSHRRGGIAL